MKQEKALIPEVLEPEGDGSQTYASLKPSTFTLRKLRPTALHPSREDPAAVYLARLGRGSQRTIVHALISIVLLFDTFVAAVQRNLGREPEPGELLAQFPWGRLRYQDTAAIRSRIVERYSLRTANKCLMSLRGVLKEAWRLGQIPTDAYLKASDLKSFKTSGLAPKGRALSDLERKKLFKTLRLDTTPIGVRDCAILALLDATGPRRSEIVNLDLADVRECDPGMYELQIRAGKGMKDRAIYAGNGAYQALLKWIAFRGDEAGPLFFAGQGKGRGLVARRMSPHGILKMVQRRGKQAGLDDFTAHDLRRSFITRWLSEDLQAVREMVGHASIETTASYDRKGDQRKKELARTVTTPI